MPATVSLVATAPPWARPPAGVTWKEAADVAVDGSDAVYVLTRHPSAVIVFDLDGTFLRSFGQDVLGSRPHGVTVAADGTAYVVDDFDHVVRVFDPAGTQVQVLGTPATPSDTGVDETLPIPAWPGSIRRAAGPFNHPTKAALSADGDVFVTDGYGNARVHRFAADGTLLHSWGAPGSGPGQFRLPHSVTVLRDGRVLVADRENDRLQVFTTEGEPLAAWTRVRRPNACTELPDGRIAVVEFPWHKGEHSYRRGPIGRGSSPRLSVLDPAGRVVARRDWPASDTGPAAVIAPHGIAVDSTGAIYVADVCFSFTGVQRDRTVHRLHLDAAGDSS